ncbi:MAG: hypothetical protein KBS83_01140 [Lachnospiraceae bacterium]|nr:hypothetical protein [Candidatus Equihabitans merdae]
MNKQTEPVPDKEIAIEASSKVIVNGNELRCLGAKGTRLMLAVFPRKTRETTRVFEMMAYCVVPAGYRIVEVNLPFDSKTVSEDAVAQGRKLLEDAYTESLKLGCEHLYLFAYDIGAALSLETWSGLPFKRAYLASPVFDLFGKRTRFRWKIQTEILYGKNDELVTHRRIRFFEKNNPCHVTMTTCGHHLLSDSDINSIRTWISGKRKVNYTNNAFLVCMMFGVLAGFFIGLFCFTNTGFGLVLGIVLGLGIHELYRCL